MTHVPSRERVLERLRELAGEQVNMDPSVVNDDSDFQGDLNFDSLDVTEFAMNVEDEFEVSIPDERAQEVRCIRDALETIWPLLVDGKSGHGDAGA